MLKDVRSVKDCKFGDYLFIVFQRSVGFPEVFISEVTNRNIFQNTLVLKDIKNFTNPEDINREWYCNFNPEFKLIKKLKEKDTKDFKEKYPQYFV